MAGKIARSCTVHQHVEWQERWPCSTSHLELIMSALSIAKVHLTRFLNVSRERINCSPQQECTKTAYTPEAQKSSLIPSGEGKRGHREATPSTKHFSMVNLNTCPVNFIPLAESSNLAPQAPHPPQRRLQQMTTACQGAPVLQ